MSKWKGISSQGLLRRVWGPSENLDNTERALGCRGECHYHSPGLSSLGLSSPNDQIKMYIGAGAGTRYWRNGSRRRWHWNSCLPGFHWVQHLKGKKVKILWLWTFAGCSQWVARSWQGRCYLQVVTSKPHARPKNYMVPHLIWGCKSIFYALNWIVFMISIP